MKNTGERYAVHHGGPLLVESTRAGGCTSTSAGPAMVSKRTASRPSRSGFPVETILEFLATICTESRARLSADS